MTDEKPDSATPRRKASKKSAKKKGAREVRKAKKTYSLDDDSLYSVALAKAKRDSRRLRYDLERLGMLTKDDRLWALLAE